MSAQKRMLLLMIMSAVPFFTFGKNQERFAIHHIALDLLKNAKAVIRYDSTEIEIHHIKSASYTRKYAITILNEEAVQFGLIREWYDNQSKINDIRGSFYDKDGKFIKSLKKKEITDRSAFGLEGIYNSDNRLKIYNFTHHSFPYTVVFEIKKTFTSIFFLPSWQPQKESFCSLESANIQISFPEELKIRKKSFLIPESTFQSSSNEKGQQILTCHLHNLSAFEMEPLSTTDNFNLPTILFVPSQFELMGHEGTMDNWESFGLFFYKLNEGRDKIPEAMKLRVANLIKNETETLQKVQILFQEMQENTRYVADEYGLSGWQTFDANFVSTKGYGDCKGLTNYLKALLNEAGIPAYTTLISAGENHFRVDPGFPANYFNHVILCVPDRKDTIWVECTSNYLKAGYLGNFTENRLALICTEKGGILVKTPEYGKEKSFLNRIAKLHLDPKAKEQNILLENTYSALFQDNLYHLLKSNDQERISQVNNSKFFFPSYIIKDYDAQFKGTNKLPQILERVTMSIQGIIYETGNNTMINFGWMRNPMEKISQFQDRKEKIVLSNSFAVRDSIYFYYPKDLIIETLPENLKMTYPFATLSLNFHTTPGCLLLVREFEQQAGSYPARFFNDYQKMYTTLKAQQEQLNVILSPI